MSSMVKSKYVASVLFVAVPMGAATKLNNEIYDKEKEHEQN